MRVLQHLYRLADMSLPIDQQRILFLEARGSNAGLCQLFFETAWQAVQFPRATTCLTAHEFQCMPAYAFCG